jgi:hypothetical protein
MMAALQLYEADEQVIAQERYLREADRRKTEQEAQERSEALRRLAALEQRVEVLEVEHKCKA